ncbi:hypothetical protein [Reyranella sp.]|nr:hypothetical protein [Reyranella sp.]
MSPIAWGIAFIVVAVLMLLVLGAFLVMRPVHLAGDRLSKVSG